MDRLTADSNIWISAVMFGGKPLALVEIARDGLVESAISDDILNETLRVLRDKFHRAPEQLEEDETSIRTLTRNVRPAERLDVVKADPDDNRILECAVSAGSETIRDG